MSKIKIQVIGPTGVGKSTIAYAIAKLLSDAKVNVSMVDDEEPVEVCCDRVDELILFARCKALVDRNISVEIETFRTNREPTNGSDE